MSVDEVGRQLRRFDGAVTVTHTRLAEAIEREIAEPLSEAVRVAGEEHARLLRSVALDTPEVGEDGAVDPEPVWRRIREYGTATRERVLEPLRERLAAIDAGQRLAELRAEAQRTLAEAASSAPAEITREEPYGTYHPEAGDGLVRRTSKASVRAGRGLFASVRILRNLGRRLIRRPRHPAPERVQVVPMRVLLSHHAASRLSAADAAVLEGLRRRVGRYLGDLERDVGAWADALLEADAALDHADHHASPGSVPPPEVDAAGEPEDAEPLDPMSHVRAVAHAADALAGAMESFAAGDLAGALRADLTGAAEAVRPALEQDLRRIGTYMLDVADRRPQPDRPTRAGREATEREVRWTAWYRQAVARMELDIHLERVRGRLLALLDSFEADLGASVVDPVLAMLEEARGTLAAVRRDVESAIEDAGRGGGGLGGLPTALAAARDAGTTALDEHVLGPIASNGLAATVRARADERVAEVLGLLASLPDALVVHQPTPLPDAPTPTATTKAVTIRLRQIAEQAYDAVLLERFRTAPDPLVAALDRVRQEARQLESVIRFNLDSALDELRQDGGDAGSRLEGARELALNGLDRSLGTLDELGEELATELPRFRARLFESHARGWGQFHDRVRVEDRVQEQILDFGYRVRAAVRERAVAASAALRRGSRRSMRWVRLGRGRAMRLVRLGQSALEGERVTEEQKRRTIDALSTVDEVLSELPLVYRRLFSFQPVSDPGMLEGRSRDLDAVASHFAHWRKGLTDAFVLTGYDGNGRTSFLNVVSGTVLRDADVRRVRLTERILDEGVFAGRLAAELDLADGDPWTFERLANALATRPRDDGKPLACIIENMEHLFLRTSADNGLVGPFLAFMSRMDSAVFWLATLAEPAWSYIEKVESSTACLVRRHALAPLGRPELESAILNRHRRSGLGLQFQPPRVTPPLLRRKLARARDDEERQGVLRTEYFDQLSRLTGQNLLLALFYWVRSVELEEDTSTVRVRALEPISFGFIDAFTLSQSFTLKAFLDHATLTLEEHDRIFRVSREESHHMFESLGNLLVIEPATSYDRLGEFVFTTIDDRQRYRIRPLVVHPVLTHLRSKNIVA